MSFSINNIMAQIDSLDDLLRGENFYVLELRNNCTLGIIRKSSKISRTIHSRDLKKLFEAYFHNFENDLKSNKITNNLKVTENTHARWDSVSYFRNEIQRIYRRIYEECPERVI